MSHINASFFDELLKDKHRKFYGDFVKDTDDFSAKSPSDESQDLQTALYKTLSLPMKAAYRQVLSETQAHCFKEKHMALTFTNMEQINLCRELKYEKHFGKFDDIMHKMRDSTRFRYQDCVVEAENDYMKAKLCIDHYLDGMKKDNE
jgi:hypothetical protein